jgi:uncharacterized protein YrzB (UPF0473 family)
MSNQKKTPEDISGLTVTLILDNDVELECAVLQIFSAGDKEYIAVQPIEMVNKPEGDVYIYRYHIDENGAPNLENIESDEEFDMALDAFDEMLDTLDFYDLVEGMPEDEGEGQA